MLDNKDSVNVSSNDFDVKMKLLVIQTIVLGMLRIVSLDIMALISDILTALMLYFYANAKTKCMAILTAVNGCIGLLYGIFRFITAWFYFKDVGTGYAVLLFAISIYGLFIYSYICYYAYYGYKNFQDNLIPQQYSSGAADIENNYGAITTSKPRHTAFSGKGTLVG
jgi:hypothetical protein